MHVLPWFWPIKDQVFLSPPRVCRHLRSENGGESAKICQVSRAHSNVCYFTRSAFGPEFFSSICEERIGTEPLARSKEKPKWWRPRFDGELRTRSLNSMFSALLPALNVTGTPSP